MTEKSFRSRQMDCFILPPDFLMGSATSGLQIEGGDTNNSWYAWCNTPGHIKDGSNCIRAADHWNRYAEDIAIMRELNHDIYRMGIEWSRIEPKKGKFNEAAIEHYRNEIELLLKNSIKPLVTLHHFSNPLWLEESGDWANPGVVEHFTAYTRYVVNNLGDLVSDWVTINEPNVYLTYGYAYGIWPPGKKDFSLLFKAFRNMIQAHIKCYQEIHKIRADRKFPGETSVGVAYHLILFEAVNNNIHNKIATWLYKYLFQDLFLEGFNKGKLNPPLGMGSYVDKKEKYYDFIGINYYTRNLIRFKWDPANLFGELITKDNAPVNDVGAEVYPEGLYQICRMCYEKYQSPIFITENGVCDADDKIRAKFIYDHLKQIARLIDEGIPIKRYYHWSLIDNFEWEYGESVRYGLVRNNFNTQERMVRASGRFYGEICDKKAVTQDMINRYLDQCAFHT